MRYNTNNPAPSNDPRDFNDNSLALDEGMASLEDTFVDRFGRPRYTYQAFHNLVIDSKDQVAPTVEAAKEAVNSTADAAISQMEETAANLGEDIGNKAFDSYAEMLAYTPKYDGLLAWVQSDPTASLNGFYQWDATAIPPAWFKPSPQPALSTSVEALRKQVSVKNRPRGKVSGDEPLIFGAAGAQMLFGVHKKVPRGPSKTKGTVPVLGKTPIPTMRSQLRPRSRDYPEPVVLVSGESVMLKTGGADTPVVPEVTYDAKLIDEQSLPLSAKRFALIQGGQVWAYDPAGESKLTDAGTWLAAQVSPFDIVRALRSASPAQPHSITKDGRIFRDGKVLLHKLVTGQSLALGSRGIIPDPSGDYVIQGIRGNLFSPITPVGYTDKLWTLAGGPRPASWEGSTAFEPVREYVAGVLGETPATSYMLAMRKWHERTTSILPQMLYSISALGGTAYAGLKKGTATYANAISQVTTAKAIAESMGLDYVVPSVSIVHGESQSGTTRAQYVDYQTEWGTDYRADIVAITGQSVAPIIMISQMLTGDPGVAMAGIPLAQMDVCETVPWFVMVGPKYWLPYFDTYHGLAEMYAKMGELEARAERLTQTMGKWQPLKVLSASVSGAVITLRLNNLPNGNAGTPGPIGKLAADTQAVSDPGNLGFQMSTGTIDKVVVGLDGASIVITATAAIAVGTVLTYALQPTLNSPQNGNGRRGCIRDTDMRDFSRFDAKPLYNWLCAFSITLEI
ncbi:hypothetical protein [Pseudomonas putida]|uniref:hypothetical protein n=1 Tax=Pseudomonas putida TaxID=303 RepID=UPI00034EDC35|nr:hypothetical protein [Pseudomonas putida]AGN83334.1 hypothetical protein L483_28300 [Pseudomonas putida H8234]HDS1814306.1 hypothetical protein [Pseudomonas putida]HDS3810824.1 hypothetical protein [Pseudomonas putida]